MALINASSLGNLAAVSVNGGGNRAPVKFFNTFISGDDRGKMERGRYQCPLTFDENNEKFFVLNEKEVHFIPLYFKKYWAKYQTSQTKDGKPYDVCVAFGWDDKSKKIEGAKTEYIIAGYLCDANNNVVKHTEDIEDSDIKAGDNVLIYFRCKGIKCNCAFEYFKRVNEAAKNLEALSDQGPTVEQNIINPRRFLVKASIKKSEPIHNRRFDVFDFEPLVKLPDELVVKIIDAANNKHLDDFNKQFDKSEYISNMAEKNNSDSGSNTVTEHKVDHVDVADVNVEEENPADSFNIDI